MAEVTPYNEHYPTPGLMLGSAEAVPGQENTDTLLSESLVNIVYEHTQNKRHLTDPERGARDILDPQPDIGRDPDTEAVIAEENIVVGALERVRFFVQKTQEQLTEKMRQTPLAKRARRLGAIAAIGTATLLGIQATPAGEKIAEKIPVPRIAGDALKTPEAKAAQYYDPTRDQEFSFWLRDGETALAGTDTYHAASKFNKNKNIDAFKCAAYAGFKAMENGTPSRRALFITDAKSLRQMGEVVNRTPAAGSVGINENASKNGHAVYVEEVLPNGDLILSEYNGHRDYDYFRWQVPQSIANKKYQYVHFELPDPKFRTPEHLIRYRGTSFDKWARDTISGKRPIAFGTFLQSNNSRYRVVIKRGNITAYDTGDSTKQLSNTKNNDRIKWHVRANRKATQLEVKLGRGKQRGKNKLVFGNGKKNFKVWNIGPATSVKIGDDSGELIGYKGKRKVWEAPTIARIALASRSAARKEMRLLRKQKILNKQKRLSKRS